MSEPLVRYTQEDKVAVIAMDDGKANALSVQMIDELLAALERAEREAGAVLLTGRPEKFCAGFDLKVMMSGPANAIALLSRGAELLLRLFELPLPVVMAVTGHAMAGGILVVCTGDRAFAVMLGVIGACLTVVGVHALAGVRRGIDPAVPTATVRPR